MIFYKVLRISVTENRLKGFAHIITAKIPKFSGDRLYCGQTVGWIKVKNLGLWVSLGLATLC